MSSREIYLDYAATAPLDPRVAAAMRECMEREFGNPSSLHAAGRRARALVDAARATVAARVGAASERIVFTSGATESNNLALQGVLRRSRNRRVHLVTSRIEHKSVLDVARALQAGGAAVTYVPATAGGWVDPQRVVEAIDDDTQLVSIMHVNNETGVVQDVGAIGEACRARGVLFHVDAAQSVGKVPLALADTPVDLCSLTAHKLCGPKGVGALYIAPRVTLAPQVHGGEQERGLRAGTVATHQVVGMGKAYELADPAREAPPLAALRDRLWQELSVIEGARSNGDPERRAAHVLNVTFPGVEGESLRFALPDVCMSAGSTCAADSPEASHVLTGMGLSDVLAGSSLRLSLGRFTTEEDVVTAAARVAVAVARLRSLARSAPAWCSA
jgi:cysteine desulfurase